MTFIYIPLCIYFNSFTRPGRLICITIYIPLCIYFNGDKDTYTEYKYIFTFHYVSISTDEDGEEIDIVSIYIPLCIYFNVKSGNRLSYSP